MITTVNEILYILTIHQTNNIIKYCVVIFSLACSINFEFQQIYFKNTSNVLWMEYYFIVLIKQYIQFLRDYEENKLNYKRGKKKSLKNSKITYLKQNFHLKYD